MKQRPENPRPAVILFSHGSLLCGSGTHLQAHARRLADSGNYSEVQVGYLNYCSPPIEEAVRSCVSAGAETIIIVPYFLVSGKFVLEDLPDRLKSATAFYPHVKFHVAGAIEDAAPLLDAIRELLETAVSPDQWQRKSIAQAQAVCELRHDCPLYGSTLCRTGSMH